MKVLLVADGRSPITRRWIGMLHSLQYEVGLVSSYPCEPIAGLFKVNTLPLAFASQGGSQAGSGSQSLARKAVARVRPLAQKLRHMLGPWVLSSSVSEYLAILEAEKPDLVHALRIPFEGMLASYTPAGIPLLVSTWGNDFTLHAPSTARMNLMTRRAMQRADGLLSDTRRDAELALLWGFDPSKPRQVVPGNGGLDEEELLRVTQGIRRSDPPQVVNPRGLRSYVRTDTFFKAAARVIARRPEVQFLCASMENQSEAQKWVERLGIQKNVRLLPYLSQPELWREYARSQVMVSISTHDGTPNTLLEAMTLGCLPVCGNLPSIREWITDGRNGLLVDSTRPETVAGAILKALEDREFRDSAAVLNAQIIRERAGIGAARLVVKEMYERLL